MWGIHRRPVNSPHKWPVMRKMFPFDDVVMCMLCVKASTELMLIYFQLDPWWVERETFPLKNKSKNFVCKMAGILSRPRYLKGRLIIHLMLSIHKRLYGNSRDVQMIYHVRDTCVQGFAWEIPYYVFGMYTSLVYPLRHFLWKHQLVSIIKTVLVFSVSMIQGYSFSLFLH